MVRVPGRTAPPRETALAAWLARLVALLVLLLPMSARADYVVEPGDVLEITVPSAPGLHRKVAVDLSGHLSVPLVGEVAAAGLPLSKLQDKLRGLLIEKNIVRDPEVTIDIAEYRPVYVTGDVVHPGAYPYHPAMTVRDAAALAGGYDLLRLRGHDLMLEAANARADYEASAIELAKETARVALLKAELAGQKGLDLSNVPDIPVKPAVWAEIAQFETQQLTADEQDADREKAYLARVVKTTQDQLTALTSEQQSAAASLDQQNQYVARARALMQRGLLQAVRMEDTQRAAEAAQGQLYEVQARAAQARKDMEDFTQKLQTVDDRRRIKLLEELRDATTKAATARYRFQAAAEKIRYTVGAQRQQASDAPPDPPKVTIYRERGSAHQRLDADEGTALLPGDNVEITTTSPLAKILTGFSSDDHAPTAAAPTAAPAPAPLAANPAPAPVHR